jgi:hypothetical protein
LSSPWFLAYPLQLVVIHHLSKRIFARQLEIKTKNCEKYRRDGLGLSSILQVTKCEIFDRSDFHDFYTIKSPGEGDFGVKIICFHI